MGRPIVFRMSNCRGDKGAALIGGVVSKLGKGNLSIIAVGRRNRKNGPRAPRKGSSDGRVRSKTSTSVIRNNNELLLRTRGGD